MAENSKIEWTDHTFNPWVGCTKISPACDHCYAEGWAKRTGGAALWQGERRRTSAANWRQPLRWDRVAAEAGIRARVFCASLADVFDNQVPKEWREDLWALIHDTPRLDWLLLTKRPQNIEKMLPPGWMQDEPWPWPNVWLGTTVENQQEAGRRIPELLSVPAAVHFLSCEPLLGPVNLHALPPLNGKAGKHYDALLGITRDTATNHCDGYGPKIRWVICGGESGPGARPMHPDWARSLRDQCAAAAVPFFFKQWGEHLPHQQQLADGGLNCLGNPDDVQRRWTSFGDGVSAWCVGRVRAGAFLDGREHREMPHG